MVGALSDLERLESRISELEEELTSLQDRMPRGPGTRIRSLREGHRHTTGGTHTHDHGSQLTGLGDAADHAWALLIDGSRAGSTGQAQDFGSTGIKADVIAESTGAAGVTADGVLLKDGNVIASTFVSVGGTPASSGDRPRSTAPARTGSIVALSTIK